MNNKGLRVVAGMAMFVIIAVLMLQLFSPSTGLGSMLGQTTPTKLTLSEFQKNLDTDNVKKVAWQQTTLTGELKNGQKYTVYLGYTTESPAGSDLLRQLNDARTKNSVEFDTVPPSPFLLVLNFLAPLLVVIILLVGIYFMLIRPAQNGGNQAMSFGRSRAKRAGENTPKVTFDDVAGIDEARTELFEIVDFLKNTKKYVALGAKIPKGILLTGPPGVGKTYLARAIAGEAGVPFFHISGSDFVEMFVGVGAARVRDLFETAKAHKPCLIFVDEIDAVGRQRGAGMGGGHDEREQTLNQLLVEMDGFDANTGVIMIAATNRPDVLDPALLRPGRFDRQIVVDAPDQTGREAILKIHSKGKPLDEKVDLGLLAKRTPGFTGADLANTLNEAALLAARRSRTKILNDDLEEAIDRVVAGPERKSRVIDEHERRVIAVHEAGHAVVGEILEGCDPVHKVTILPRGMSLGSTWHYPEKDKFLTSEPALLDKIAGLLGGRVAEEVVFGEVTTGASNDLQRVSAIAKAMVTEYGMSKKLGTLAFGRHNRNPFLGRDYGVEQDYSEDIAKAIDEEVRRIVDENHEKAVNLLTTHRDKLDAVTNALLQRETIDREEFLALMRGETLAQKVSESEVVNDAPPVQDEPKTEANKTPGTPRLEPGTA